MSLDPNELYIKAIEKFGKPSQIEMLLEELGELVTALQKYKRSPNKKTAFNVCDEMADVQIMLEQNRLIFNSKTIDERREFKLENLSDTLSSSLYSKYSMDPNQLEKSAK